jgi:hypothetical protein
MAAHRLALVCSRTGPVGVMGEEATVAGVTEALAAAVAGVTEALAAAVALAAAGVTVALATVGVTEAFGALGGDQW